MVSTTVLTSLAEAVPMLHVVLTLASMWLNVMLLQVALPGGLLTPAAFAVIAICQVIGLQIAGNCRLQMQQQLHRPGVKTSHRVPRCSVALTCSLPTIKSS